MSGIPHDHYEPKSAPEKWVESRLPILGLIHSTLFIPTPKNLNWMWIWGIVLAFCLVLQIATGVVLVMHYNASVGGAFASVEHIMRDVNGGWALRYVHANGASLFFFAVYCHIFRGIYYGSYKTPREITWIIGMLIFLLMMATAFMGYVLPWGQMSFWGATVITGLFSAIPMVGSSIQTWLLGGPAVDNPTLTRFFSLHYLLPFVIAGLVIVHIWAFHTTGNNNPTGVEVRRTSRADVDKDTLPFWPYFVIKDLFALVFVLVIFAAIVGFMPNFLGHPDNYIEANPLKTPTHIVPEWYFLPFYAMLRAITFDMLFINSKLAGVLTMFGSIAVLLLLALARHQPGAFRALPADVQDLVLAAGRRLRAAALVRLAAAAAAVRDHQPARDALLVRVLPGDHAGPRHRREAARDPRDDRGRLPGALRHRRGRDGARRHQQARRMTGRTGARAMLKTMVLAGLAAATLGAGAAMAQEAGHITDFSFSFEGPFGRYDQAQLQRGLQVYTEICSACHGLKFVTYRELAEPGGVSMTTEQMRAYAAMHDVDDADTGETRPATPSDHFQHSPLENAPDLSLMAKAREGFEGPSGLMVNQLLHGQGGPEYIASLLLGFTGEEKDLAGSTLYENPIFPGGWIAMPPPITDDDQVTYADGTPATKAQMAQDVAAFLMWTAEPKMMPRKAAGLTAVLFLVVLAGLLWFTNKKIWAPHKGEHV